MLQNILNLLYRLFGYAPRKTPEELKEELRRLTAYQDVTEFNITATAANKVANIVVEGATVEVQGTGPRSDYMRQCMKRVEDRVKLMATRAMGIGGVWLVPYNVGPDLHADIIDQTRFFVVEQRGVVLRKAQYIAEIETVGQQEYMRVVYCALDDNRNYTIENRATRDGNPVPLASVPKWAEIPELITIPNVDQMLVGFVRCPVDSRDGINELRGVPLTHGNEKLISMILTILNEIPAEYRLKRVFVGASDLLLNGKGRLPDEQLYRKFSAAAAGQIGESPLWEIFNPEIRSTAYFDGINFLMGLLEKGVGVNQGILTDLESADATATAIKRSTFDTFNLVDAMRASMEQGIEQIAYAFDVMATAFGFAPQGEYDLKFDWSYSLLENSTETWAQLTYLFESGGIPLEKLLAWQFDITEEEAIEILPRLADTTNAAGE